MNPKVSIIMPVYGVEKYVGRAIESVLSQTFQDWELFCVDDGTKDNSGIICDSYAEKDERIKVIHKENGGAPSARNVAIDKAQGEYMFFMDSDDWCESHMLEDLISVADRKNSELIICGFFIDTYYSDTEFYEQQQFVESCDFTTQEEFRQNAHKMFDASLLYAPWNKIVRSDFIKEKKLYFPTDTFWDDLPWNLSVVRDVERVSVISNKYYHFIRQRAESEGAKYRKNLYEKREEEQDWMEELYSYWNVNSDEVHEFLSRRYIERVIGCIENLTNQNCSESLTFKLCAIRKIICSQRVRENVGRDTPNSSYMKIMLVPIKLRLTLLTYLEGKTISFVKRKNTKIFAALKANR